MHLIAFSSGNTESIETDVEYTGAVDLPFGQVFELETPNISSIIPFDAKAGEPFTITGTGFYPSFVENVIVKGTPLDEQSFGVVDENTITATATADLQIGDPVVVVTGEGPSNAFSVIPDLPGCITTDDLTRCVITETQDVQFEDFVSSLALDDSDIVLIEAWGGKGGGFFDPQSASAVAPTPTNGGAGGYSATAIPVQALHNQPITFLVGQGGLDNVVSNGGREGRGGGGGAASLVLTLEEEDYATLDPTQPPGTQGVLAIAGGGGGGGGTISQTLDGGDGGAGGVIVRIRKVGQEDIPRCRRIGGCLRGRPGNEMGVAEDELPGLCL